MQRGRRRRRDRGLQELTSRRNRQSTGPAREEEEEEGAVVRGGRSRRAERETRGRWFSFPPSRAHSLARSLTNPTMEIPTPTYCLFLRRAVHKYNTATYSERRRHFGLPSQNSSIARSTSPIITCFCNCKDRVFWATQQLAKPYACGLTTIVDLLWFYLMTHDSGFVW